jgi:serine protease Do
MKRAILAACALALSTAPAIAAAPTMAGWSDANIAQKVLPAVVNITVEKLVPGSNGRRLRETFFGSGFVFDPSGLIVTNRHVIEGAVWITVGFADRSQVAADLLGACGLTDVAVLKVDAGHPLMALKFADSDKARIGDPVLAVGNPLGLGTSVSSGIISALNRDIMESPFDDDIQTDAAINHGNSGGPLIDRDGEVVGLDTALSSLSDNGGSIGIGYAIPANDVSYVLHVLLSPNPQLPGWLGAHLQDMTTDLARSFGLTAPRGFIVTGTEPGSPARTAGLVSGDIILRYGKNEPGDTRALMRDVAMTPPGHSVPVVVWRNGKQVTLNTTIAPWPNMKMPGGTMMASSASAQEAMPPSLGLALAPPDDKVRKRYSLASAEGVVVTSVDSSTEAYDRGVAPGDVILKVQNTVVSAPDQVQSLVDQARAQRRVVAMLVAGKNGARWITLYFGASAPSSETRALTAESPAGTRATQTAASPAKP